MPLITTMKFQINPYNEIKLQKCHYNKLTGFSVLCSLKVSSSNIDCSFDNLSFFLEESPSPPQPPPSSSSLPPPREHEALSTASFSSPLPSLSLLFPLILDTVLFGEETPFSSSNAAAGADGCGEFASIPRRNDLVSVLRSVT
ncbi:hypothetical protein L195_g051064 [Trifolium pratense]|uniref:Uncharacterized protein n=1 Tax=Trifolium pratense TaxID=57577 RepID=A0A2K3JXE6_TRIPR|nr:hypothetical protein L195_g051064 [Trifolium pratense]